MPNVRTLVVLAFLLPFASPAEPRLTRAELLHSVEPKYTEAALRMRIQGTVLLSVTIDAAGHVKDIEIVSPLGWGLDESAIAAVSQWRFKPTTTDGAPVPVGTFIGVNFRLEGVRFNSKLESQRTKYNRLVAVAQAPDAATHWPLEAQELEKLVVAKYSPALDLQARLLLNGRLGPKDPARAIELLREAVKAPYGPSLFLLGLLQFNGDTVPRDTAAGLALIHKAATYGSDSAQLFLARRYEDGVVEPIDLGRAHSYYQLCAAAGRAECQAGLGKLLLGKPGRRDGDLIQAVAWLQLAAARGDAQARALAAAEREKLSPGLRQEADRLQPRLLRKLEAPY